ncbi:MAG: hypothetical protein PF549_02255, partial [Patescibacteria group bacterium]|nr:hypothetical protein [Patescibacteria group bacterium]
MVKIQVRKITEIIVKDKRILLLDTKDKPHDLLKTFYSLDFEMTAISNSNQLAHNIKENGYKTAIINIHHNDEFELLEHISKISLTYPEVAIVLLTPEAIQPSLNWGPKVFSMVKPISAYSVLKKLSLFNDEQFPYDGVIRGEVLLSLLDRSLASESSYKITLNYEDKYKAEILTRKGKWASLYINDSLKNNKLLLPFNWEGAFYKVEETENAEIGEFEITDENYNNFRKNLRLWLSLVNKLPSPLTVMRLDQERFVEIQDKLPSTVDKVIKYIDGKNSLLDILIKVKMRPFYVVQNISYLYFNDCIELEDEEGKFYKDEDSSEGLDVEKVVDIISSLNYFNKPKKRRNSKELASWIMDPMGAAKELEQELKKNIRKNRDSGPQKRGRKKRRTQPGLGDLIDIIQSKAESNKQIDNNKWKNPEKKKEKKQFNSVKSNDDPLERMPETLQGIPFAGIELDSEDALLDVEYKRQESKSGIIELKSYIEKNIQNTEDNKKEEEWKPIAEEDLDSPLEELSHIRETRKKSGYLPTVSQVSKYSKKFRNKLEKIRKNKDSIRIKIDNLVEMESSEDKSGELLSQDKTAEKSKKQEEKQEETEVISEKKEFSTDKNDKTAENSTDSESEPKDSGKIKVSEEEVYDVDAMENQV